MISDRCRLVIWAWLTVGVSVSAACAEPGEATGGASVATSHCADPVIDSWYGDNLRTGLLGQPQRWVSILGNVSSPDGVTSFAYSLDGAPPVSVPIGADGLRLQRPGDFNIGIERSVLTDGVHTVELQAESGAGAACTRTIVIDHTGTTVWPMPYTANFDTLTSAEQIHTQATVVDGKWGATGTGLRILEEGYDRLVAIGDRTWTPPYEVRASLTIEDLGPWGSVGVAMGWEGHTGSADPPIDWPLGSIGWVRNKTTGSVLEITTYDEGTEVRTPATLLVGETYVFRLRHEPISATRMRAQLKVWNAATPEPAGWMLTDEINYYRGSVLLVVHAADVTWHEVAIGTSGATMDAGVPPAGDAGAVDGGLDSGVDSGVDSGPLDGGLDSGVDSGPLDGGLDSGVDSGPLDGGAPDSGSDSGALDAGAPDSGPVDGGMGLPDAEPADAMTGAADAQPMDAMGGMADPPAMDAANGADAEPPDAFAGDAGSDEDEDSSGCSVSRAGPKNPPAWLLGLLLLMCARNVARPSRSCRGER